MQKKETVRRSGYFYRLFLIILFSSMLPILIMNIFSGYFTSAEMRREIENVHRNKLYASSNSVNLIIDQIVEGCSMISENVTFKDFGRYSGKRATYLENLPAYYPEEDMKDLARYFRLKGEVYWNLNRQMMNKFFIDSVCFYDMNKSMIYTDENKSFTVQDYYDQDLLELINTVNFSPYVCAIRDIPERGEKLSVITLLIGNKSMGDRQIFAVNIDTAKLGEYLFAVESDTSSFMFMTDGKYVVANSSAISESYRERIFNSNTMDKLYALNDNDDSIIIDQFMFIKHYSATKAWSYISVLNIDEIFSASEQLSHTMLILSSVLLIASFTIAVISSNNIYRPILHLQTLVAGFTDKRHPPPADEYELPLKKNESIFQSISAYLSSSEDERIRLQSKVRTLTPHYNENTLLSMLYRGSTEHHIYTVEWGFKPVGYALLFISINLPSEDRTAPAHSVDTLIKQYLMEMTAMTLSRRSIAIQDISGKFFLLCNVSSEDYRHIYSFSKSIVDEFREDLGASCYIGISSHHTNFTKLPEIRWEAQEALSVALLSEKEKIYFYSDVHITGKYRSFYNHDYIARIVDSIHVGNAQQTKNLWSQMLENFRDIGPNIVSGQARVIFLSLCSEIYRIILLNGGDPDEISPGFEQAYKELLDGNEHVFLRQVDSIIDTVCSFFIRYASTANNRRMDSIVNTIEEHYHEDITISDIAETVGMNPDYLGRLFKEYTGFTFVEYLTKVRIEKSKELLKISSMRVQDIGIAVGYQNSNYFIRVFKNACGMTPKEYRQIDLSV